MRTLVGVLLAVLPSCVGSSVPGGAITGTPRPPGASGSGVDPTAGEIKVAPWGWTLDNLRVAPARMASTTDRETIRRALREELGAILACYERARRDAPDLRGVVRTRFIIELDGRPRKVEAHGMDLMMTACLRDLIASMLFPEPTAVPVRVDMPFAFSPPVGSEPLAGIDRPD
jgi:hypothetical protein